MADGYRHQLRGAGNPNFRAAGQKRCVHCGVAFQHYNKARRYCTRECYNMSPAAIENRRRAALMGGRGARLDENHHEIVDALRAVGADVLSTADLGKGVPDLVVAFRGTVYLIEIKNPKSCYGRGGLNKLQRKWAATWTGAMVHVVKSIDEALHVIGIPGSMRS
jgi:hypothetical protein